MVLIRILGLLALLALSLVTRSAPINAQAAAPVATPSPAIETNAPASDQPGSTRAQAEALAAAASDQFGKVLDQRDPTGNVAQAAGETGSGNAPTSPASGALSASPPSAVTDLLTWLGKANDDYQSMLLRLSRPLGPNPVIEAARRLERERQLATVSRPAGSAAPDGASQPAGIGDWVSRTASEYQREVVSRLAGLPPAALIPSETARAAADAKRSAAAPALAGDEMASNPVSVNKVGRSSPASPKIASTDEAMNDLAEIRRGELERKAAEAARRVGDKTAEASRADEARKAPEAAKGEAPKAAETTRSAGQKPPDAKQSDDRQKAPEPAKAADAADVVDPKGHASTRPEEARRSAAAGQVEEGQRRADAAAAEHVRLARDAADRIGGHARKSTEALAAADSTRAAGLRVLEEARKQEALARRNRHAPEVVRAAQVNVLRAAEQSRELQLAAERARRVAASNIAFGKRARSEAELAAHAAMKISLAETQLERAKTAAERAKAQKLISFEHRKAAEASRRALALQAIALRTTEPEAAPPRADVTARQAGSGVAIKTRAVAIRSAAAKVAAAGRCRAAGVRARAPGWYTVRRGDSLWGIAMLHYRDGSRWQAIRRANASLRSTRVIHPCQRLLIPR
jgi:colicin import membrane protein